MAAMTILLSICGLLPRKHTVMLRINEKDTYLSSKQLRQLLLQYHNLGMKPFHTVGKKAT